MRTRFCLLAMVLVVSGCGGGSKTGGGQDVVADQLGDTGSSDIGGSDATDVFPGDSKLDADEVDQSGSDAQVDQETISGDVVTDVELDTAEPFSWAKVVADPGFGEASGVWTVQGAAEVVLDAKGRGEANGFARFAGNEGLSFEQHSLLNQTVVMPGPEELPASLNWYQVTEVLDCNVMIECSDPSLQVFLDSSPLLLLRDFWVNPYIWSQGRVCLGEGAARAGEVVLTFQEAGSTTAYDESPELSLDDVVMQEDVLCPLPGVVMDGDFEGNALGWQSLSDADMGSIEVHSELDPSAGKKSLHATFSDRCGSGTLMTWGSVPLNMKGPSVTFYAKSNGSGAVISYMPGMNWWQGLYAVLPTTDYVQYGYCLPKYTIGNAVPLMHTFRGDWDEDGIGCASKFASVYFDELKIEDSPYCEVEGFQASDRGFERLPPLSPASWVLQDGAAATEAGGGHSGEYALKLHVANSCDMPRALQIIQLPEIPDGQVAKLTFWARKEGGDVPGRFTVLMRDEVVSQPYVPVNAVWSTFIVTLDKRYSNEFIVLMVGVGSPGGICTNMAEPTTVYVDDLFISVDPI